MGKKAAGCCRTPGKPSEAGDKEKGSPWLGYSHCRTRRNAKTTPTSSISFDQQAHYNASIGYSHGEAGRLSFSKHTISIGY
jgi:hypothetical protein